MGCKISNNAPKVETKNKTTLNEDKAKEIILVQDEVDLDECFRITAFKAALKYCAIYSDDHSTPEEVARSLDNLHHCFDQCIC